jgi:hypothetical protein
MNLTPKPGLLGTLNLHLETPDCETEQTETMTKGYIDGVTKLKTVALL